MARSRPRSGPFATPRAFERWLIRQTLVARGGPPISLILWNGEEVRGFCETPVARVRLREPSVLRELVSNPDLAFGEAYADGRMEVEGDLSRVMESAFRGQNLMHAWLRRGLQLWGARPRRSSLQRSRENIHRHYDLGNEFYRLWLDERLLYTCAYFPTPEASLEQAQLAKMDHVSRKLALRPGERVVEAGCGWGSLALHMAEHYGVRVRAYNISSEQIRYGREQAQRLGLEERVEFINDDYRNITGRYDVFVSVGMLEHVGKQHYPLLGRIIDGCLEPDGRGLIHSIGRSRAQRMNAWIERYIFPGAYIPSLQEMMSMFEPQNFAILDVENIRLHYAKTLEHWLDRFEKAADRIEAMFDERFVRMWRLYLASSKGAFRAGSCHLYQVVFSRASNNRIPWTRAPVYTAV
jgi:cyclopropane-fatty-acyl-phospholipid synthase